MSEVNPTGATAGPGDSNFYAVEVEITDQDKVQGTITLNGVSMSPLEAAEATGLSRAAAMKKVSETSINVAQKFLERLRMARDIKQAVTDQNRMHKAGEYGPEILVTPAQREFMNNELDMGVRYTEYFYVNKDAVGSLSKDILDMSGLQADETGLYVPPDREIFNDYVTNSDGQLGDFTSATGAYVYAFTQPGRLYVTLESGKGGGAMRFDDVDNIQEDLSNHIDQISNDNTLHMSKMKNILSKANSAEEMVNSLMNQTNEQRNQRISRYS